MPSAPLPRPLTNRLLFLPVFAAVAGGFGVVEYIVDLAPGFFLGVQNPSYELADAAVRAALVPVGLLLAFFLLARRTAPDLGRSGVALALSVFLGTLAVFLPIDVGRLVNGTPLPGFSVAQTVAISVGDAVSASMNHAFIGVFAAYAWTLWARGGHMAPTKPLHGTEDVSLVGVAMVGIYSWEYLAQAFESTYRLGVANPFAAALAGVLGAGSPAYYVLAIWQETVLLMIVPFVLFFALARRETLDPFAQAGKIAVTILLWSLFLRAFTSYFYVYFAQLLKPGVLADQSFAATLASEVTGPQLIGIAVSTVGLLFLGLTAMLFGYYSRVGAEAVSGEAPDLAGRSPGVPGMTTGGMCSRHFTFHRRRS